MPVPTLRPGEVPLCVLNSNQKQNVTLNCQVSIKKIKELLSTANCVGKRGICHQDTCWELNQRLHRSIWHTWPLSHTFLWIICPTTNKKPSSSAQTQLFHEGPTTNALLQKLQFQIYCIPKPKVSIEYASEYWENMICKVWWSQVEEQRKATSSNFRPQNSMLEKWDSCFGPQFPPCQKFPKHSWSILN